MPANLLYWGSEGSGHNHHNANNSRDGGNHRDGGNNYRDGGNHRDANNSRDGGNHHNANNHHNASNHRDANNNRNRDEDSVLCEGRAYSIFQVDHLCTTGFSSGYNCSPYDDELYPAPPSTPLHCLCGVHPFAYDLANASITIYKDGYTLAAELPNHYLRLLYPSGITPQINFADYGTGLLCASGIGSSKGPFAGDLVVAAIPMDKPWSPKFVLSLMDRAGLRKELADSYSHMRTHGASLHEIIIPNAIAMDYVTLGQCMPTAQGVVTFGHEACGWDYLGEEGASSASSTSPSSASPLSESASSASPLSLISGHIHAVAKSGVHVNLDLDLGRLSAVSAVSVFRGIAHSSMLRHVSSITISTYSVSPHGLPAFYGMGADTLNSFVFDLRQRVPHIEVRLGLRVVPGFTDQNGEFEALSEFVNVHGVPYIRLINDTGNPHSIYEKVGSYMADAMVGMSEEELEVHAVGRSTLGVRNMLQTLRKRCKGAHLGSYNIHTSLFEGRTYPYLKKTKFKKPKH